MVLGILGLFCLAMFVYLIIIGQYIAGLGLLILAIVLFAPFRKIAEIFGVKMSTPFIVLYFSLGLFLTSFLNIETIPSATEEAITPVTISPGEEQCYRRTLTNSDMSGNDRFVEGSVGGLDEMTTLKAHIEDFSGFSHGEGTRTYSLCVSADESAIPGNYPITLTIRLLNKVAHEESAIIVANEK